MKKKLVSIALAFMLTFSMGLIATACGTPSDSSKIKIGKTYEVSEVSIYSISVKTSGVYKMSFTSLEDNINCVNFYSDAELENAIGYYWIINISFDLVLLKGKTYYIECEYNGLENYSFIIEPTVIPLVENIATNVSYNMKNEGDSTIEKMYTFKPTEGGGYTFAVTTVSVDAECSVQVSDYINFTSEVGTGLGTDNFSFEVTMEAGQIYYILASCDTGAEFSFTITKNV